MTDKPKLENGWGPPLEGEEWEAYNKKFNLFLTYNQEGLNALNKLDYQDRQNLPLEIKRFIQMARMSISTAKELISHMSFVRVEKEKPRKNGTETTINNKKIWDDFVKEYVEKYARNNPFLLSKDIGKKPNELEHYIKGKMIEADNNQLVKNKNGAVISSPKSEPSIKDKIKLACESLGYPNPYSRKNKKGH